LAFSILCSGGSSAWATELRPSPLPQRIGDQFELKGSIAEVQANPSQAEPNTLLTMAIKLADRGDVDEALFWFCIGSIRASLVNSIAPDDTRIQITGTLVVSTAELLNNYLVRNPRAASRTIRRAIAWDEQMDFNMSTLAGQVKTPRSEWPAIRQTSRDGWRKIAENLMVAPIPAQ
jgi:hypothetical protein